MFIKILTPNHNGKIELTVRDLEALIQEAVDKAVREKCANCNRCWYNSVATTPYNPPYIACNTPSSENKVEGNIAYLNGGLTVESLINNDRTNNAKMVNYTVATSTIKGE